jgi:hypothetical protein
MEASLYETHEENSRVVQSVTGEAADAEVALELAARKLAEQLGVVW